MKDWLTLARPRQWVKNAFVAAPLLFSGRATEGEAVVASAAAVVLFSLLSSGVYALNDVRDAERDREHPLKRSRPVAAGRIPARAAVLAGSAVCALTCVAAWLLDPRFGIVAVAYVAVNLAYTLGLREVVILDVFIIASFFLMRLVAGSAVVDVAPSIWLLLCGGLLALYLAFAKRRHELSVLGPQSELHRRVLGRYDASFLDQVSAVLLSVTVVAYVMYALSSETAGRVGSDRLAYSVVFVLFGSFRYLLLSHRREGGGDPAETLLSDGPLAVSVLLWLAYCGWVLYFAG